MSGAHRAERHADPQRRLGRDYLLAWLAAVAVGAVVGIVAAPVWGPAVGGIAAWNAALAALLGHPWWLILRSDARHARAHAAVEDPGKIVLFFITVIASTVSLFAAVFLLAAPEAHMPAGRTAQTWVLIVLGGVAVAGSWLLVHTAFTFHYAHLYYREDETLGGLDFPGGEEPDDLDFAYFAFTIGMTFQTSDVEVSERGLRRTVLRHAMLSFVFNTAILALAVSLLFGRLQ